MSVIRLNIFLSLFYIDAIGLIALLWPTLNFAAARFDIIPRILIINSVSATLNNKNWFSMFFFCSSFALVDVVDLARHLKKKYEVMTRILFYILFL